MLLHNTDHSRLLLSLQQTTEIGYFQHTAQGYRGYKSRFVTALCPLISFLHFLVMVAVRFLFTLFIATILITKCESGPAGCAAGLIACNAGCQSGYWACFGIGGGLSSEWIQFFFLVIF